LDAKPPWFPFGQSLDPGSKRLFGFLKHRFRRCKFRLGHRTIDRSISKRFFSECERGVVGPTTNRRPRFAAQPEE
jgi:hypothetical protein